MGNLFGDSAYQTIKLGDIAVNRIGLGTNRVSDTPAVQQFLQQAVDDGVNFIDTAHVYTGGGSETTIGSALSPFSSNLIIATKGGMGSSGLGNNQPDFLRSNLEDSLRRLRTGCVTLYQLHRIDSDVPLAQTMSVLKSFQDEGKIKHIGLSEATVEQLDEARQHGKVVSVQNQYSLTYRNYENVLEYCAANGIIFIPWFPLRDVNGEPSLRAKLQPIADKYSASPQQIALAWLLKKSPLMLPIPGTLSIEHLRDNVAATHISLSDDDFRQIDAIK